MDNEVHRSSRLFSISRPDLRLVHRRSWPNHRPTNLEDGRFGRFATIAALTAAVGRQAPGGSAVGVADICDGDWIRIRGAAGADDAGDGPGKMIPSFDQWDGKTMDDLRAS
jgi:hypothetical protein